MRASSTQRHWDVYTTVYGRQKRCYNVETTSCTYWDTPIFTSSPGFQVGIGNKLRLFAMDS